MEERYYMDHKHRDRCRKHNSYVGRLELESYSKRWWDTKKLVFATNKHVPNIPVSCCWNNKKKSLRIAAECEKQCMWDSQNGIPNSIRGETSIFIALGAFNLEMKLFHAYGQFISESGGPHILNERLVLAKGSTKSFQTGKNYKRCKRMHEILALAMDKLHFESFLETHENEEDIRSTTNNKNTWMNMNGHKKLKNCWLLINHTQWKLVMKNMGKLQTTGYIMSTWSNYIMCLAEAYVREI